jgi:hypothetical protein
LLFKLWKAQGYLDEWRGVKVERILCELFARLIGLVIQHWLALLSCWDDLHRSFPAVSELIRGQVPTLVHAFKVRLCWRNALRLIKTSVAGRLFHSGAYQSAKHLTHTGEGGWLGLNLTPMGRTYNHPRCSAHMFKKLSDCT